MKSKKLNLEFLIPVILIVLCTFTIRYDFSPYAYCVVAVLSAIYFFPIRFLLFNKENITTKDKWSCFILNFAYALAIGVSVVSVVLREYNRILDIIVIVLNFIFLTSIIVLFIRQRSYRNLAMSLLFNVLLSRLLV